VHILRATVKGRVQGVGFRLFVLQAARNLKLSGYVKNQPDGSVFVLAHGERTKLEELLSALRRGPLGAWVETIETEWANETHGEVMSERFEVRD
jgi:acylphosphatase